MYFVLNIDSFYFPRVAIGEPEIGDFDLVPIFYDLFEDTIIVSDPVSPGWVVEGCHRVKEACC